MPYLIEAHGHSYRIEDPGGLIGESLRAGTPYEAKVLEHIYRRGLEGLAIDVGANIGNHTLWFSVICGLQVIAVEPLTYRQLGRNLALNGLNGAVRVWPIALGAKAGRAESIGRGRLRFGSGPVAVGSLDDFRLQGVSVLKIDVEGTEPEVLRGAAQTIARERPLIYAEAWDEDTHARAAEILEPLIYRHTKTFGATPLEQWEPQ